MAEHLKLINPEAPPQVGRFVLTETARDILLTLRLVQGTSGGAMTMIAAAPGTGKTETLYHFLLQSRRVFLAQAVSGEGGVWSVAQGLFSLLNLGDPNGRDLADARRRIGDAIGFDGMLLLDEAQYLTQKNPRGRDDNNAFEWLRAISEASGCKIVFCGDLALGATVDKIPQLRRRMLRPILVRQVTKEDVEAVVRAKGYTDPIVFDALTLIARRGGGLGDVDNVLSHAQLLTSSGRVELGHVMAAIEDLKLNTKARAIGGK